MFHNASLWGKITKRTGFSKSGQIRAITLDETNAASASLWRKMTKRTGLRKSGQIRAITLYEKNSGTIYSFRHVLRSNALGQIHGLHFLLWIWWNEFKAQKQSGAGMYRIEFQFEESILQMNRPPLFAQFWRKQIRRLGVSPLNTFVVLIIQPPRPPAHWAIFIVPIQNK